VKWVPVISTTLLNCSQIKTLVFCFILGGSVRYMLYVNFFYYFAWVIVEFGRVTRRTATGRRGAFLIYIDWF
jgi:hypothetical protein